MWRYLKLSMLILAVVIVVFIFVTPHVAALQRSAVGKLIMRLYSLTDDVVITWQPAFGSMPVTDFTVVEYEGDVTCSWTNSPTGVATMIRAKYGSDVLDETDGYLVYYGPAETCQDLGVYVEEKISDVHYTAYSVNAGGVFSIPVNAVLEVSMLALILVTCALIALAFWQRTSFLYLIVGMVTIGFGIYWIGNNTGFIYVMEGVAGMAIGFYMIIDVARGYLRRE